MADGRLGAADQLPDDGGEPIADPIDVDVSDPRVLEAPWTYHAAFDRTPYIVGFRAARERFALLTAHIRYGHAPVVATFAAVDRLETVFYATWLPTEMPCG